MTVTVEFEPELEEGLRARAQARGVTIESLVRDLVSQHIRTPGQPGLKLPSRNLGDMGSLHRRDIYNDADLTGNALATTRNDLDSVFAKIRGLADDVDYSRNPCA